MEWKHNGEQVQEGERFHFVNEGGFHCLDVVPVLVEDGGEWTCIASNDVGRVFSSCHLNVLGMSKKCFDLYKNIKYSKIYNVF